MLRDIITVCVESIVKLYLIKVNYRQIVFKNFGVIAYFQITYVKFRKTTEESEES